MYSNPVASIGYRHFLVNSIQSLIALDMHIVTDEERSEDVSFGDRFRALSDYMRISIPDYRAESDARNHLISLNRDVYELKRIYEKNSPSITIQRCFRGFKIRKNVSNNINIKKESVVTIQKMVRGMLLRKRLRRELKEFMTDINEGELVKSIFQIRQENAVLLISNMYSKAKSQKKWLNTRQKASIIIQKMYRGKRVRMHSHVKALGLSESKKLYICREQKPFLLNIIKELVEKYPQHGSYLDIGKNNFSITQKYCAIRVMEPEGAFLPELRINHFSLATFRSKITYQQWNKNLSKFDVFENMMIFDEKKTKESILVMKSSGLKFTKAKIEFDMKQVEQNRKFLMINP